MGFGTGRGMGQVWWMSSLAAASHTTCLSTPFLPHPQPLALHAAAFPLGPVCNCLPTGAYDATPQEGGGKGCLLSAGEMRKGGGESS